MRDRARGYRGIKLRRPRRTSIGYKFGGRDTQQRVNNYMATNPAPLPPIEVSLLTDEREIFFRVILIAIVIYVP